MKTRVSDTYNCIIQFCNNQLAKCYFFCEIFKYWLIKLLLFFPRSFEFYQTKIFRDQFYRILWFKCFFAL